LSTDPRRRTHPRRQDLYELIANAPGDDIALKKADNHRAEIKSGKVTYRIVGMHDRDFRRCRPSRGDGHGARERSGLCAVESI
jgi:hypothetical protein